jgi:translocation and assembly module TamA
MRFVLFNTLLLLIILVNQNSFAKSVEVCSQIRFSSEEYVDFSSNEKKMICGDPDNYSWKNIPLVQAKIFIKNFLQDRGRYQPSFRIEDEILYIDIGPISKIKKVEIIGHPPKGFKLRKRNPLLGDTMTPKVLDDIAQRSFKWLKQNGYACPEVNLSGNPKEEIVFVEILPGEKGVIAEVIQKPIPGLKDNILRRYDAFVINKEYDVRLLDLTLNRAEADGIVQHTHFTTECQGKNVNLEQHAIVGKPRLFSVGFGANTEDYFIAKTSWKHARLGKSASSVELSLFGSFLRQEFSVDSELYLLPNAPRWYLSPSIILKREDEKNYELISSEVRALPSVTWDNQDFGLNVSFGPRLKFTRTFRGAAEETTRFLSTYLELNLLSHDFEYYATNPISGYSLEFLADFNHKSIFSDLTAQQFSLSGHWLSNIGNLDPPLLIVGLRGNISTTFTDRNDEDFGKLPPDFLYYLGGSADLRGFSRGELPVSTKGSLTSFFSSLELRFANILPLDIQPIIFSDVGILGKQSAQFDKSIYLSPGFGLRWASKIGTFRTTLAHGFEVRSDKSDKTSHWQWHFSFGEEF